ncbi:hypothetical protein ACJ72_04854 [Emergomyces africanus]|uniref:Uncharacterized protein n=1 Tax=Emergomyces africanus TaxID=1955775 RepID=A0A1B7NVN7_9EURO|nr:hypothetical protein ACJ72_04854 [Emergomyces africanus]
MLTIHKQTVLIHPIIDEFYDDDPNHDRSAGFAVSKGLVSKAPGSTVPPNTGDDNSNNPPIISEPFTPADTPGLTTGGKLGNNGNGGPKLDGLQQKIRRVHLQA